jgi:hypothetical protein
MGSIFQLINSAIGGQNAVVGAASVPGPGAVTLLGMGAAYAAHDSASPESIGVCPANRPGQVTSDPGFSDTDYRTGFLAQTSLGVL